jgi:very-short-patch-repair endonuclease
LLEKENCDRSYGGIHDDPKVSAFDKSRTEFLESLGFRVLRFKNKEVFDDLALVIDKIKKFIN